MIGHVQLSLLIMEAPWVLKTIGCLINFLISLKID